MKRSTCNNLKVFSPGQEKKVCKLIRSLYGLKQAPKQWHENFDNVIMAYGFKINECDKCVYVKTNKNDHVIVCLYIDDMLTIGCNIIIIKATKQRLANKFEMKDISVAYIILGIKISRTAQGLVLSQSHYVDKILNKYKKHDIVIAKTTIDLVFI